MTDNVNRCACGTLFVEGARGPKQHPGLCGTCSVSGLRGIPAPPRNPQWAEERRMARALDGIDPARFEALAAGAL